MSYLERLCEQKLESADEINKGIEEKIAKRDRTLELLNTIEHNLEIRKEMHRELQIVTKNSQNARKQFIVDELNQALSIVFDESYEVDLDLVPYKDTYKAVLKLISIENGVIKYLKPQSQNGGLCRQVISLQAGFSCAELMGVPFVIMDEALNGGDSVKLRKTQQLMKNYLKSNPDNILILNEHNTSLYEDVATRIFEFHKEGKGLSGHIVMDDVIDQEEKDLTDIIL